jgi:hypothetical protein
MTSSNGTSTPPALIVTAFFPSSRMIENVAFDPRTDVTQAQHDTMLGMVIWVVASPQGW